MNDDMAAAFAKLGKAYADAHDPIQSDEFPCHTDRRRRDVNDDMAAAFAKLGKAFADAHDLHDWVRRKIGDPKMNGFAPRDDKALADAASVIDCLRAIMDAETMGQAKRAQPADAAGAVFQPFSRKEIERAMLGAKPAIGAKVIAHFEVANRALLNRALATPTAGGAT